MTRTTQPPTTPFDQPVDPDARTGQEARTSRNVPVSPAHDVAVDPDGRTGQEARTSRNTATSPGVPPVATPAPAPAPVKRQPGKDEAGKDLPVDERYPDTGHGVQEVCLDGGGGGNGSYIMIGKPIPQDITIGSDIYNISDRAKGIYTYRVK